MSDQASANKSVPEVLIIGAGIGGLMLAILLEQISIPYHIYERATEVKPLGSALSFGGHVLPALEQLGIHKELVEVSKSYTDIYFYDANCKKIGTHDVLAVRDATGYDILIFSRPRFYELLQKRVPVHKISFNKKIVRTEEKEGKVHIYCSDDTSYSGDVLIGADGAHSGVRKSLYEQLDEQGILPKSDLEAFSVGHTAIVGVATSTPEKYPQLKEEDANFSQILYEGSGNCYVITLPNNQISWGFGIQLSNASLRETHLSNAEWGPEANDNTLKDFRDFPCPLGGTMGDIFDATPKHLISKVLLEEKVFTTWHHGRTVLLGDACHKFHPSGGQGAANAIHDAIALANCLYNMTDSSLQSINTAFKEYYAQRHDRVEEVFKRSHFMSKLLNGQNSEYRPQVAWLPLIENRGNGTTLPQEGRRYDTPAI
ncbi:hypothetical protein BGZ80_002626 [Entomortierella chlamydospora]|uniref:FAD-binding domain-containing protein n=1 Tax=Entomortierella chlamydospora TaxID=101097 RepID=A0A9P6MQ21_9FUNG|nr:hypothetical protein BGZ80_002626 [Entomortierella chlamydospora]